MYQEFKDQLHDRICSEKSKLSRRTVKIVILKFTITIATPFDILGGVQGFHAGASQKVMIAHANKFPKISQKLK